MDSTELKNTAVEANPGYERVAHDFEGNVIKGPKEQVKLEEEQAEEDESLREESEKAKADTPAEKAAAKKTASSSGKAKS